MNSLRKLSEIWNQRDEYSMDAINTLNQCAAELRKLLGDVK